MRLPLCALPFFLIACATPEAPGAAAMHASKQPINQVCPRSGLPVAAGSWTEYRGHVVGFCNRHCRDDFAAHVDERPDDRRFFDAAIAELEKAR